MTLKEACTQGKDCCQFDGYSCYRIWKCEVTPSWGFCFYKLDWLKKKPLSNHTVRLMVEISMNVFGSGTMWCGYAFLFSLPAQYWPFTNTDYHVDGRNLQPWPPWPSLCYSTFFVLYVTYPPNCIFLTEKGNVCGLRTWKCMSFTF